MIAAIWPVVQYAWTFFYLRLVEIDAVVPPIPEQMSPAQVAAPADGPAS